MIGPLFKRSLLTAGVAALLAAGAAGPSFAVVPEIKVDPETGIAEPHPDLERALAAFGAESESVTVAEIRWQRAPWHNS